MTLVDGGRTLWIEVFRPAPEPQAPAPPPDPDLQLEAPGTEG